MSNATERTEMIRLLPPTWAWVVATCKRLERSGEHAAADGLWEEIERLAKHHDECAAKATTPEAS